MPLTKSKRWLHVHFSQADCRHCRVRKRCTHSKFARRITLQPQVKYETLQKRRQFQQTSEFKELYQQRAGVEGTLSQGVRRSGLRQCCYVGLAKTHLQHILTAVALNLIRLGDWLSEVPHAQTRQSRFMDLKPKIA
jgi:transposase